MQMERGQQQQGNQSSLDELRRSRILLCTQTLAYFNLTFESSGELLPFLLSHLDSVIVVEVLHLRCLRPSQVITQVNSSAWSRARSGPLCL
eukprot:4050128-Amphidinium_carterae.1